MNKMRSRYALLAALAIPGFALAASETESNHPVGLAQTLGIVAEAGGSTARIAAGQATGGATVDAVIGNLTGASVQDLDFFTFSGKEGDVVTLDIDDGIGGARNVDTILAIFGPAPGYAVLRLNDDVASNVPVDSGSRSRLDSMIVNFKLPTSGSYTVGVSSYPRRFANGGTVSPNTLGGNSNGDYMLLITGVSLPLLQISIDIKPGNDSVAPINPRSKGKIPVALLGASDFLVRDVDLDSLTFGHSGNEASLAKCHEADDVNGDVWPDMLCHFENQDAKFESSDDEAILRGKLSDGRKFEGRGWLKVVPVKAQH